MIQGAGKLFVTALEYNVSMAGYNPKEIEHKWQQRWRSERVFGTPEDGEKEESYVLDMFPYPSGDGLHVGHVKIYTASDVYSRYLRMTGRAVLHPMGWDAFGLPTENSAIERGIHPAELTKQNVDRFRDQMQMMGFSYDWDREINTTDPEYVKWTQWIFLKLFERGLAYEATIPINWCSSCKTGLANEEVVEGKCERCGTKIELKPLRQWMLKITAYADRLLGGLDKLDWPSSIMDSQRNWIGRSEGVNFKEKVKDLDIEFEVYDSIPQTFMAQTFTIIAPEHPMVKQLVAGTEFEKPVMEFVEHIGHQKGEGKFDIDKDMSGIFTGRYVDNPFGTGDLPIWVASFVLADYGTGIVNASAHDERDFAFAKKYDIPLKAVLLPEDAQAAKRVEKLEEFYREPDGVLQEPEELAGRLWGEARRDVIEYIIDQGYGEKAVNFKLRDWVFSRQRYWGEPIPIIHCEKCGVVPVPEEDLPVRLPEVDRYEPTGEGESPLALIDDWVNVECPKCEGAGQRETNTMPQWAGSSWYWIRFVDPKNSGALAGSAALKRWLPVDTYVGGAEHAVLHLLYARWWNMVLFDERKVPNEEPFSRLEIVGLLLGDDGQKMSKSRGNVVTPDEVVAKHGADATRVYVMFMGPFENSMPWSDESMAGAARFLRRVWDYNSKFETHDSKLTVEDDLNLLVQRTIKRVTDGIERFRFNTGIAALMELLNELEERSDVPQEVWETYILLLAPFAPHVAEEMWQKLGGLESLVNEAWPVADEKLLAQAQVQLPVQVNGKVRGELTVGPDTTQEEIEKAARAISNVARHLAAKEVLKVVYVPGRMINFVVS